MTLMGSSTTFSCVEIWTWDVWVRISQALAMLCCLFGANIFFRVSRAWPKFRISLILLRSHKDAGSDIWLEKPTSRSRAEIFSGSGRLGNRFQLKLRTLPLKIISSRSLKASTEKCFYRRRNSFFSPMPDKLTRCDATALFIDWRPITQGDW